MKITTLNLELTNRCNLRCPYCCRTLSKGRRKDVEKQDFNPKYWDNLQLENIGRLILCGTYGDAIFYPYLHEFIEYVNKKNPFMKIQIQTNGTAHDTQWWKKLASIMQQQQITFALDGLEDTHNIHRIGSNFNKVLKNMQTTIDNGCPALWQFIIFKHNEHQIREAKNIAKKMGASFILLKSFFYEGKFERPSIFPHIMSQVELETSGFGEIHCRIDFGEVSVVVNGDVHPCCHATEYSYDKLGFEPLNLKNFTLQQIADAGYIQKVRSEIDTKQYCRRCIVVGGGGGTIESFLRENLKMKKLKREQKKDVSNK